MDGFNPTELWFHVKTHNFIIIPGGSRASVDYPIYIERYDFFIKLANIMFNTLLTVDYLL
jgi:hypothetical protein